MKAALIDVLIVCSVIIHGQSAIVPRQEQTLIVVRIMIK